MALSTAAAFIVMLSLFSPAIARGRGKKHLKSYRILPSFYYYGYYRGGKVKDATNLYKATKYYYKSEQSQIPPTAKVPVLDGTNSNLQKVFAVDKKPSNLDKVSEVDNTTSNKASAVDKKTSNKASAVDNTTSNKASAVDKTTSNLDKVSEVAPSESQTSSLLPEPTVSNLDVDSEEDIEVKPDDDSSGGLPFFDYEVKSPPGQTSPASQPNISNDGLRVTLSALSGLVFWFVL
jgi:hypothetical protein